MEIIFVYITAKDVNEARTIGKTLIEERIAACVNIFGNMQSIYRWEGKICEENEAVLIAKTRKSLLGKITQRVKELHSYSCPCVIALQSAGGNDAFIDWIIKETKE